MDDLVSREAVKKWLERWDGYIDMDIVRRMQYRVIDIPSAQPDVPDINDGKKLPELRAEPEPSYWMPVNNDKVACHKCKSVFVYWLAMYSCCPSCGAYMRGCE